MKTLTNDEKRLICLALDEFASSFSGMLTEEENAQVLVLANRLRGTTLQTQET